MTPRLWSLRPAKRGLGSDGGARKWRIMIIAPTDFFSDPPPPIPPRPERKRKRS
jgi:hypothetical protein